MHPIERVLSIEDLRQIARKRLPRLIFDFIEGGAESEIAARLNVRRLGDIRLRPDRLVDVSQRSQSTELFGRVYDAPVGIAPTGLADLLRPGADRALAQAAARANLPYILSTAACTSIETIARISTEHVWYQLYVSRDRAIMADMVHRAAQCGVRVLVVTVDVPVPGRRERDLRNGFTVPLRPSFSAGLDMLRRPGWLWDRLTHRTPTLENLAPYAKPGTRMQSLAALQAAQMDPSLKWDDLKDLRKRWRGALVVKGILSAQDARQLVEVGADGLVVSNHGGRQLDAAPAAIDALEPIAEAVRDRITVLFDGGIRRGADVARALALGAHAVLLGRATLYGVAAAGERGVAQALNIIHEELDVVLANLGCPSTRDLGRRHVFRLTCRDACRRTSR